MNKKNQTFTIHDASSLIFYVRFSFAKLEQSTCAVCISSYFFINYVVAIESQHRKIQVGLKRRYGIILCMNVLRNQASQP